MPIPTALSDLSTTAASNSPAETDTISNTADDYLRGIQAVIRQLADTGSIASATTTDLSTVNNTYITVTGTTTITGLGTVSAGIPKVLIFAGALTFTHNATSLILFGENITTAAGDVAYMVSLGSGNWRCLSFDRRNGQPTATAWNTASTAHVGASGAVMSGVKLQVTDVPTADFTPVLSTAADCLLVKGNNSGNGGLTIATPNTGSATGWVMFADTAAGNAGAIGYDHSVDVMSFYTAATTRVSLDNSSLRPVTDNVLDLGTGALRWQDVYATNGTIQTSDEREKVNITPLNHGLRFIQSLSPIRSKWRNGTRWHFSVTAQDIKRAIGNDDAGIWIKHNPNDPASREGLRLGELIPIMVKAIQELTDRIERLERRP